MNYVDELLGDFRKSSTHPVGPVCPVISERVWSGPGRSVGLVISERVWSVACLSRCMDRSRAVIDRWEALQLKVNFMCEVHATKVSFMWD